MSIQRGANRRSATGEADTRTIMRDIRQRADRRRARTESTREALSLAASALLKRPLGTREGLPLGRREAVRRCLRELRRQARRGVETALRPFVRLQQRWRLRRQR